jgi:hypothetical protein
MNRGDAATPETLQAWLAREVAAAGGRVLLLGDAGRGVAADAGAVHWLRQVTTPDELPLDQQRFALAAAAGVFERLHTDTAAALLAALRDRCAQRVLVALPGRPWSAQDMRGFGFESLGTVRAGAAVLGTYGFDIDRYKRTPDWLNARHWANPELWGRFRW